MCERKDLFSEKMIFCTSVTQNIDLNSGQAQILIFLNCLPTNLNINLTIFFHDESHFVLSALTIIDD